MAFWLLAESNYAPIKGECFGVASALHKSRYYSLGCDKLLVGTDHKQLLGVLNDRSLESIDNPRLICKGENFALSRAVTPVQCEVQMMALGQGDINPGQHLSGERYPSSQEVRGISTSDYL